MLRWKIIIVVLVSIAFLFIIFNMLMGSTKFVTVKIGNATIKTELADTLPKQIKGLMFRKSLPEDEGMWFDFKNDGYPKIWMMNMSFPIDIVWINSDLEVVHIVKNAQPCGLKCESYGSAEKARYVLEVNANFTDLKGIKIGSVAELS